MTLPRLRLIGVERRDVALLYHAGTIFVAVQEAKNELKRYKGAAGSSLAVVAHEFCATRSSLLIALAAKIRARDFKSTKAPAPFARDVLVLTRLGI